MNANTNTRKRRIAPSLVAAALALALVFAATVPVAAATQADIKTLRAQVAATNTEIIALMQQARDAMASVRDALQGNRAAMEAVEPDLAAALKTRLDALRQAMMTLVDEREYFSSQMVAFRSDMLNRKFDDAYDVLLAVQARQATWKTAIEGFIADAKSLAADIKDLASQTGPIWEQRKAEQAAFLTALKEKKAALLANHEAIRAQADQLKGILEEIRAKIAAGALDALSPEDRQWVKDQLSAIRTGIGQTFDGSVAHQMQLFKEARTSGDHAAALAALDQALAIQSQRGPVLAGYIAQAQAVLDKLDAAATVTPPAAS